MPVYTYGGINPLQCLMTITPASMTLDGQDGGFIASMTAANNGTASANAAKMLICPSNVRQKGGLGYIYLNDRWYPNTPLTNEHLLPRTMPVAGTPANGAAGELSPLVIGANGLPGITRPGQHPLTFVKKVNQQYAAETELALDVILSTNTINATTTIDTASLKTLAGGTSHTFSRTAAAGANVLTLDSSVHWRSFSTTTGTPIQQPNNLAFRGLGSRKSSKALNQVYAAMASAPLHYGVSFFLKVCSGGGSGTDGCLKLRRIGRTGPCCNVSRVERSPLVERDVVFVHRPRIDLAGAGDLRGLIVVLFLPVGDPSGQATDDEHHGEHGWWGYQKWPA